MTDALTAGSIDAADPRMRAYFGDAYPAVSAFTEMLADEGVLRGLIGPREVGRLWERHILNSAAVAQFLPVEGTVVDLGTGAGLPGVVLAAMRPDLRVVLVEPMERRVAWLRDVTERVALPGVEIVRARAEELDGQILAEAVTARAVAPLERLAGWSMPLLRAGGTLLALKGRQAADELEAARAVLASWGADGGEVAEARTIEGLESTTVVRVVRDRVERPVLQKRGRGRRRRD